jgi:hypothetical protein
MQLTPLESTLNPSKIGIESLPNNTAQVYRISVPPKEAVPCKYTPSKVYLFDALFNF